MKSKWQDQPCPLCFEGVLRESEKQQRLEYKGRAYEYMAHGSFCDHCGDGFADHDEREEAAWVAFRDRVDHEEVVELARI